MDWYTIEYLYPESFKSFKRSMFPNMGIVCVASLQFFDIKNLYKFFDKEGVFLNVETYSHCHWVYTVTLFNGMCISPCQFSGISREEAEEEGFNECFKLLDKKIRDVNHIY